MKQSGSNKLVEEIHIKCLHWAKLSITRTLNVPQNCEKEQRKWQYVVVRAGFCNLLRFSFYSTFLRRIISLTVIVLHWITAVPSYFSHFADSVIHVRNIKISFRLKEGSEWRKGKKRALRKEMNRFLSFLRKWRGEMIRGKEDKGRFCSPHTSSIAPPPPFLSLHTNTVSHLWQEVSRSSPVQTREERQGGTLEDRCWNLREKKEEEEGEGRTK